MTNASGIGPAGNTDISSLDLGIKELSGLIGAKSVDISERPSANTGSQSLLQIMGTQEPLKRIDHKI